MNYFAIERNGECWSPVHLADSDRRSAFKEFLSMTYDEMKSSEQLEDFVVAAMDATNAISKSDDAETVVTLVGEDNMFIWGIIIGPGEDKDDLKYVLVDWKATDMRYCYAPD